MGNALRRSRRKRKKMKTARMIPLAQMPVKKAQHAAQKSKRDISSEVDDNGSRREDDRSSSETDTHRSSRSVEASSKSSTLTSQRSKFELDESSRSEDSSKGALDEKLLRASVRSKHRKRSPSRIQFATDRPSNVVNAQMKQAVEQWVERTLQKGVRGLLDEFAQLRSESSPSADAYQHFTDNQPFGRNRYKDIFCLDESRIVLRGHPKGNDYIHANYVSTPLMPNRFICTQAPKEETIYDFWLMVVQERIEVIVMLGDFIEKGKQKCAVYFPRKQNEVFTTNDVIIRCDSVRAANRPICVHCSAGVGRTGSVVTIAYILECLLSNVQFKDLVQVLKQLRKQRAGIVQTEMQYLYVHRILLMCFMDMKLIGTSDRLNKFIREYNRLVSPVQ
uniref:Tyrosine-protein phosphatase domain-containing protein n=1 Tax=Ascaris lumbricoides TaxID=6252 RepID=A0A9J2PFC3_ASCLU